MQNEKSMYIFEIHGKPAVYSKPRMGRHGFYDPKSQDKELIRWQIRPLAPKEPLRCFVEVHITFFVAIPKGTPKLRETQMMNRILLPRRPDLDNLAYIINNAMTGIVYEDDCLIYKESHEKYYSDHPKTVIKVIPREEQLCG